jgi:2,4-dienoyl-CoA reductase (NADPH2)
MRPHTVVDAWHGDTATMRSTLTDLVTSEPFDWLVIAETPHANDELSVALGRAGVTFHQIGDCVAPRRASLAIYEGRSLAMRL